MEGKITYINTEKGYGFINVEDYVKDVFFHVKDLRNSTIEDLKKGDIVSIENISNDNGKGNSAKGVSLVR